MSRLLVFYACLQYKSFSKGFGGLLSWILVIKKQFIDMHYNTTGLPPKTTGSATKREGYMPDIMQKFAKSYHALLVDFSEHHTDHSRTMPQYEKPLMSA